MICSEIPCVILAGGKSSRMGKDKSLLPFGDFLTLTQFQLDKFSRYFKRVYISCESSKKFDFKADFIEDLIYKDSAPLIALISAFRAIESQYIAVISVDTPFFNIKDFQRLCSDLRGQDGVVAKTKDGTQPLCAIYNRSILKSLDELVSQGQFRFSALYDRVDIGYVEFENDKHFTNLNYYSDYMSAIDFTQL
jgi:molybdopterin-guanine dinucleotide biosynthesis protein A